MYLLMIVFFCVKDCAQSLRPDLADKDLKRTLREMCVEARMRLRKADPNRVFKNPKRVQSQSTKNPTQSSNPASESTTTTNDLTASSSSSSMASESAPASTSSNMTSILPKFTASSSTTANTNSCLNLPSSTFNQAGTLTNNLIIQTFNSTDASDEEDEEDDEASAICNMNNSNSFINALRGTNQLLNSYSNYDNSANDYELDDDATR